MTISDSRNIGVDALSDKMFIKKSLEPAKISPMLLVKLIRRIKLPAPPQSIPSGTQDMLFECKCPHLAIQWLDS